MDIKILEEPLLQFGKGKHICPRIGIYQYEVSDMDIVRPDKIVIGLIGMSESIGAVISWIKKCKTHIGGKKTHLSNLFPNFPGFNSTIGFKSEIVYDDNLCEKN
jgi:hypothetical protein